MRRPFIRGKKIKKLPTRLLNDAVESAATRETQGNRRNPIRRASQFVIDVHNDTGEDLDQWTVVGLGDAMIDPADNEQSFRQQIGFEAEQPLHADHLDDFAVLVKPVADGQVGRALLSGLINCKVNVNNVEHRYVRPQNNTLDLLETCGAGGGRILWPFPFTATGEQWATVELTPFTGEAYGYLTAYLGSPTVAGSPTVLTPATANCEVWDFNSSGFWANTEDEVEINNVWEQVTGNTNSLVTFQLWGGQWVLTGISCDPSQLS